jgi:hypothetical protein
MPLTLTLVRRPRSASYVKQAVQTEIQTALQDLSQHAVERLKQDIEDWADQPEFKAEITVNANTVSLGVTTDMSSKAGQIYKWVNDGTGERSNFGGSAYEISPHKPGGHLGPFFVPHSPISMPFPVIAGFPSSDEPMLVSPLVVHAPGIYPRNFISQVLSEMRGVGIGTFRNVIDAAIKRGLRK